MDFDCRLHNVSQQVSQLHHSMLQHGSIDALLKSVCICANEWLDNEVESSACLCLLHGQLEPVEQGQPCKIIMYFCHYLEVPLPTHCRVLTRLLLEDHPLGMNQLL